MSEEEDLPLRRRVPGAARAAPAQAARPALPEAVLRRMQAAVDAARGGGDEGPITEPIPKITAQTSANGHEAAAADPPASRGRVVEFKRPAKRNRGESAGKPPGATHSKRKHGGGDPAKSAPQTREQAPAALETRESQHAPASPETRNGQRPPTAPAASKTRDAQPAPAAPAKPDAAPRWEQRHSGASPAGTPPPPLPQRRPTESPPAATRSDRDAATPADPKDASPRVVATPAGPSAAGTMPPAPPADGPAAAAKPPLRTAPTPAPEPAALARAASQIPKDLRDPRRAGPRLGSGGGRRPIGIAAALVVLLAAGGVAIALATRGSPGSPSSHKNGALHRQELVNATAAVTWIGQQVSPGSVIACDQAMCDALKAQGYAADKLQVLGPTSTSLRSAAIVVETGKVRTLFGTSLNSALAPAVLTRIGTGAAEIEVRVVAPGGATAYQRALAGDLAARKQFGTVLLHGPQITASATAQRLVIAGAVDWRLLVAIADIGGNYPVDIIGFGNNAAGATPSVPLRYADLNEHVRVAGTTAQAYVAKITGALQKLKPEDQPLRTEIVHLPGGVVALRIEYPAPSPLGLLGPPGG